MWTALLGIDIAVWVAILVPVLIFLFSVAVRKINKKRELNLYKNLIESWTESKRSSIDTFIYTINEYSKVVEKNTKMNVPPYHQTYVSFDRLSSMRIERIADVIINLKAPKSEAVEKMYRYVSGVEFIIEAYKKIIDYHSEYCSMSMQIADDWNNNFTDFQRAWLSRETHSQWEKTTSNEKTFYDKIGQLLYPIITSPKDQNGEVEMPVWNEEFITPAMKCIDDTMAVSTENMLKSEIFIKISTIIRSLQFSYLKWNANRSYGEGFRERCKHIKDASDDVFESIDFFKNHKLKRWWLIK